MKFSVQLETCVYPAWRTKYINYRLLKRMLDDVVSGNAPVLSRRNSNEWGGSYGARRVSISTAAATAAATRPATAAATAAATTSAERLLPHTDGESSYTLAEMWRCEVHREVMAAAQFLNVGVKGLEDALTELSEMCDDIFASTNSGASDDGQSKVLELRALQALNRNAENAKRLRGFAELNHVALFKIMKKHDKKLRSDSGLTEHFPKLMDESRLGDLSRLDRLDAEIRRLSLLSHRCSGLGAEVSVGILQMAAGVQSEPGAGIADVLSQRGHSRFVFFLGTSLGLLIGIIVLIWIPPLESVEKPFSASYFMAPFPVFRVSLSLMLALWCAGMVASICTENGINHMYLLGVDPRCRITANFFYIRAAILTTVWILVFGMYVIDYKWMVLPQWRSAEGYNLRSSSHYCIYPSILAAIIVIGALSPSRIARRTYTLGLFKALARTALAPLFVVSFADNVVGDVLTSLVKPLQDIPPCFCYFFSSHPQTTRNVHRFVEHGDVCPKWVHSFVKPILAGLPVTFRALQCLRRFRDTREPRNLYNFGKYMCALAVVVITTFDLKYAYQDVIVSTIATIYAATWDICLDWGLGRADLTACSARVSRSPLLDGPRQQVAHADTQSVATVTEKRSAVVIKNRIFKPCTYRLCAMFDILARLTWVQTLVPVNILTNDICQREVILFVITAIEIMRRAVWAILRIEHEQHTNASGFRAILWVPKILEQQLNAIADVTSEANLISYPNATSQTPPEASHVVTIRHGQNQQEPNGGSTHLDQKQNTQLLNSYTTASGASSE